MLVKPRLGQRHLRRRPTTQTSSEGRRIDNSWRIALLLGTGCGLLLAVFVRLKVPEQIVLFSFALARGLLRAAFQQRQRLAVLFCSNKVSK